MRLWSISPKYLDVKGLLALWRETLLAKKVLQGLTKGYRNHPQLIRFKQSKAPLPSINFYLQNIWQEACERGYNFDKSKFEEIETVPKIKVTSGQVLYEREHLLGKLAVRDEQRMKVLQEIVDCELHPLFSLVAGEMEEWERI